VSKSGARFDGFLRLCIVKREKSGEESNGKHVLMELKMKMSCPSEERLADYVEGRLGGGEISRLEKHLADCETCLETLVVANGLMRDSALLDFEPVPKEVTDSAVQLVARHRAIPFAALMEKLRQSFDTWGQKLADLLWPIPWGKWQQATIRSSSRVASENLVCMKIPFKGIELEIEIEKTGDNKAHIRVRLSGPNKPRKPLRITLKQGEREIASYLLDRGDVLFEDTSFGHYGISLAEDDMRLGTYLFEIKENRHG
jgi:hypothetical protein